MPIVPTFPGVYVQEISSGVRTITGVSTSVAAFIDYFKKGRVNDPVQIFSMGDFEREFGGLDAKSEASYAIQQFFLNGGTEAWVVRVVDGLAAKATANIGAAVGGAAMFTVEAISEGKWGNYLRVRIDGSPGATNAAGDAIFDMTVSEYASVAGRTTVVRQEKFIGLTVASAMTVVNDEATGSALVRITASAGAPLANGTVTGIYGTPAAINVPAGDHQIQVTIGADTASATLVFPSGAATVSLRDLALILQEAIRSADAANPAFSGAVVTAVDGNRLRVLAGPGSAADRVVIAEAPGGTTAADLNLNAVTITGVYATPNAINVPATNQVQVSIGAVSATATLAFPGGAASVTLSDLAGILQGAIRAADPAFAAVVVTVVDTNRLRFDAADSVTFAEVGGNTTAADLGLNGTSVVGAPTTANAQQYTLGSTAAVANTAQAAGNEGNDGSLPKGMALHGSEANKTGIHALDDVDLFNLLCIPRTSIVGSGADDLSAAEARDVMDIAIQYCTQRRAFFIMDTPAGVKDFNAIRNWMQDHDTLRSEYAAIYYPRVTIPDPLNEFRPRSAGASGTIAGVMARTDSSRGVWKAPAGTDASLRGVSALEDTLTDARNGTLNPLGINCLRTFPIFGTVAWGARTLDGADAQASEYKYVPIRRLASFIEESLFRGTKWVIFEPNDEPLWAQIRLNVTAFMQNLFRQGAFQGQTPREAYFVRCDSQTTTQNDRNLGIVNLVVGFAPLKPAEFLIITIQQIAGQLDA